MPTISGPVYAFRYGKFVRHYSVLTLPFADVVDLLEVVTFDGLKIQGEQREPTPGHFRALKRAVEAGRFTPTSWAANLTRKQQAQVKWEGDTFTLELGSDRLRQTDGSNRKEALLALQEAAEALLKKAQDKGDQEAAAEAESLLDDVANMPVTFFVYLDGEARIDFVNLQKGRPIDRSLLFGLELANDEYEDESYRLAADVARVLHYDKKSPLYCLVRFDSRKGPPIPVTALCARGGSDLATSLIGLARLGLHFDVCDTGLADYLTKAYQAIYARYPDLVTTPSSFLATRAHDGKIGQTTIWVGLSLCLCYAAKGEPPSDTLLREAAECAYDTLRGPVNGNLSSANKRQRVADFARCFFRGRDEEFREEIPVGLINLLTPSAFGLRGRK